MTFEARRLPAGWTIAALSDFADINPPVDRLAGDDVPVNFVPMRAVEPEGGGLARPEMRTYGQVKKGYTSFRAGDVITAKITPCMENGKTTVVPRMSHSEFYGSTEFHVIRPREGISPDWIAAFLLQHDVRRAAQRSMAGAVGQMRVPTSFLEQAQIPLAPSNEQLRIVGTLAELLSDLAAAIESLERVRAKLAQYRASVLKAAVDGTLTADWRAKHPDVEPASKLLERILAERRRRSEEEQLAKFKSKGQEPPKNWKPKCKEPLAVDRSALSPLPPEWCWASVDQAGEVRLGRQRAPQHHQGDNMRPYLRVANVFEDRLDLRDVKQMNFTSNEFTTYALRFGDILLNEGQSPELVGRPAMYRDEIAGCCYQKTLLRFRASSGLLPAFALAVFRAYLHNGRFKRSANITTNIAHLAAERFLPIEFPLPPTAEQEVVVDLLDDHLSVISHLEIDIDAKLKGAQSLRQAILRHAFTGKLVAQDPNDEPASELLKRIAAEREARAKAPRAAKPRSKRGREAKSVTAFRSGPAGGQRRIARPARTGQRRSS